jgi:hypothetical protein
MVPVDRYWDSAHQMKVSHALNVITIRKTASVV